MTPQSWRWSKLSSNPTGKESRSNARAHSGPPWGGPFVFLGCKRKRPRWEPEAFLQFYTYPRREARTRCRDAERTCRIPKSVIRLQLSDALSAKITDNSLLPSCFSHSCASAASLRMAFQSVDACACRGASRPSERGPLRALPGAATMETGGWGRMTGMEYHPSFRKRETPSASGSSVTGSAATGLGNARH